MEGGPAMIKDGLFDRFPVDAIFGMHNMPGLELGKLYFRDGDVMAAVDNWEIELTGKGSHGSMPELSIDPVVAGASLVMALQTIVSRNVSPHNRAVVTVGAFIGQRGQRHRAVRDPAPLDPHQDARGSRAGARQGALDPERRPRDTAAPTRSARACRARCSSTTRKKPRGGRDRARRFRRRERHLPGTHLSRIGGLRLHAAGEEGHVLLHRQRRHADGASSAIRLQPGILPKGAAYWVTLTERYLS